MTGLPKPIAIACLLQYSGVPTIHQILLSRAETDYPKVRPTADLWRMPATPWCRLHWQQLR